MKYFKKVVANFNTVIDTNNITERNMEELNLEVLEDLVSGRDSLGILKMEYIIRNLDKAPDSKFKNAFIKANKIAQETDQWPIFQIVKILSTPINKSDLRKVVERANTLKGFGW